MIVDTGCRRWSERAGHHEIVRTAPQTVELNNTADAKLGACMKVEMETDPKTDLKKLVMVTCNALNSIQTSVEVGTPDREVLRATDPYAAEDR
jgi:hypothetical protein